MNDSNLNMIVKLGLKNQQPFWIGEMRNVPEAYRDFAKEATGLWALQSDDPYASRTYIGPGIVIHVQAKQKPLEYGVR